MGRRTLLLIASILIAAVGTALVALYVRGADARAREGTAQVRVYFTTQSIRAGTAGSGLLSGALEPRTVALDSVPKDAVEEGSTSSFQNLVTKVGIVSGAPLQLSMFNKSGAADPSSIGVTEGRVGASFELTDPQRVANLLQPGMFVSVYFVPTSGKATVAIDRVKVLQIGTQTVSSSTSLGSAAAQAANPNADQVPRTILTFDLLEKDELNLLEDKRDGELALGVVYDQKSGPSN